MLVCAASRAGWRAPTRRCALRSAARAARTSPSIAPRRKRLLTRRAGRLWWWRFSPPSTRKIDRFTKLEECRRHPGLRHILLVDPDSVSAKLYSRPDDGVWLDVELIGADALIALTAIDVSLPLGALYERVNLAV